MLVWRNWHASRLQPRLVQIYLLPALVFRALDPILILVDNGDAPASAIILEDVCLLAAGVLVNIRLVQNDVPV